MKKYFDGITKLDELRKAYKKWAMELHPDHDRQTEMAFGRLTKSKNNLLLL